MSPDDVGALIAQAAAWGIRRVALTGAGEPFRDKHMLGHVRHANELGHLVTITSNGFPISEAIADELAAGVVSVSISIHGATDATHEAITGVAKAGANAWRAIARLVAARRARAGSKLSVNVSTVIQRANVAEIPALVRRAHAAGVDGINIQPINLQHGSFRDAAIAIPPPPPCEVAIVRVSRDNARGLVDRVDELRAAGAVAIQLVWDGRDRGRLERHVFAALERGRASPAAAPVVLADTDEPVAALLMLIELRNAGGVAARAGNPALAVANRRSP
jgi:hypothetical protein